MVSIVIPTYNRCFSLNLTIQSIYDSCDTEKFELIICDNNSTDDTDRVVADFKDNHENIRYVLVLSPGLHEGRNRGLMESKFDIISYLDDDVIVKKGWLEAVIESFQDYEAALVGGKVLPNFLSDPPDWILDRWEQDKMIPEISVIDHGDELIEIPPNYVFGCNFSVLKSIVIDAKGFHPDGMPGHQAYFRGDGESYISEYVEQHGFKCLYHPEASVLHEVSEIRMTIEYFAQRSFREGITYSYVHLRNNSLDIIFLLRKLYSFLRLKLALQSPDLQESQRLNFLKGFILHHWNCIIRPKLLKWTRQPSYLVMK